MTSQTAVTEASLLESNDEYRRLHQEHAEFESRIKVLAEKTVLSTEEEIEETRLKKLKLAGRDRMEAIARAAH